MLYLSKDKKTEYVIVIRKDHSLSEMTAAEELAKYLCAITGAEFPIVPAFGCRSELQNAKVMFLADKNDYQNLGLHFARLRFTTETAEDCVRIFRCYRGEISEVPVDFTRGLYTRGVK